MCQFCEINQDLVIYETKYSIALINYFQMGILALMVISKRHVISITELGTKERNDLFQLVALIESRIKSQLKPLGLNTFINESDISGQSIPHLHCHIVARGENDGLKNFERLRKKIPISKKRIEKIQTFF